MKKLGVVSSWLIASLFIGSINGFAAQKNKEANQALLSYFAANTKQAGKSYVTGRVVSYGGTNTNMASSYQFEVKTVNQEKFVDIQFSSGKQFSNKPENMIGSINFFSQKTAIALKEEAFLTATSVSVSKDKSGTVSKIEIVGSVNEAKSSANMGSIRVTMQIVTRSGKKFDKIDIDMSAGKDRSLIGWEFPRK